MKERKAMSAVEMWNAMEKELRNILEMEGKSYLKRMREVVLGKWEYENLQAMGMVEYDHFHEALILRLLYLINLPEGVRYNSEIEKIINNTLGKIEREKLVGPVMTESIPRMERREVEGKVYTIDKPSAKRTIKFEKLPLPILLSISPSLNGNFISGVCYGREGALVVDEIYKNLQKYLYK